MHHKRINYYFFSRLLKNLIYKYHIFKQFKKTTTELTLGDKAQDFTYSCFTEYLKYSDDNYIRHNSYHLFLI